jgi:hypothetical protein
MARKTNPILDSYGMLSPRPLSPRERLAGLLSDTMGAGRNGYQGIMGLLGQSYDQTPEAQARDALNPVGGLLSGYDSGRDAAGQFLQGRYASGLGTLGLAVVPLPVAAKTPVKRAALEANSILHRAVAATKGAEIIPEGLKMRVGRGQLPSQEMEQSVRGGVFYLPEGSSNARHYRKGTTEPGGNYYGGPQQISGETLFKNPLVAKGATGGKAPQTAYDSLVGKGAYDKMRQDAMQVIGLHFDKPVREEAAERFLSQYAPELAGNAQYIIENSKKGNQLAYALQEAAVASAVRRAGHDGVLGYSVGRTGQPFLSEVFDVRESHYPSPDGGYRMWPEFEGE